MPVGAKMQFLGEIGGKKCYWAAPGIFVQPGFYFWDGKENVHVPIPVTDEDRARNDWKSYAMEERRLRLEAQAAVDWPHA
jgi:hypothetical protein